MSIRFQRFFYGIQLDECDVENIVKRFPANAEMVEDMREYGGDYYGKQLEGFPCLFLSAQTSRGCEVEHFNLEIDKGSTLEDFIASRNSLEDSQFYSFLRQVGIDYQEPSIQIMIEWEI